MQQTIQKPYLGLAKAGLTLTWPIFKNAIGGYQVAFFNTKTKKWKYVNSEENRLPFPKDLPEGLYILKYRPVLNNISRQQYGEWGKNISIEMLNSKAYSQVVKKANLLKKYMVPNSEPEKRLIDIFYEFKTGEGLIGVIGPTDRWSDVSPEPTFEPWRFLGRPRVTRPYQGEIINTQPVFAARIETSEPGCLALIIQIKNDERYFFYRIMLGNASRVNFEEINLTLPEGEGMCWAAYTPYHKNNQNWFSRRRLFKVEVKYHNRMLNFNQISNPGTNAYKSAKQDFYKNLGNLSYEENLLLRKEEITDKKTIITSAPNLIQLSLGHRCNINCIMCGTGRKPDFTTIPDQIMNELPLLYPFLDRMMVSGGEPLIYPSLKSLIDKTVEHPNLTVAIGTNGVLLKKGWLETIIKGRFALKISIDAATKKTYERIRRRAKWDDLLEVFNYIIQNRTGPFPQLVFSYCVMRCNYREIPDFIDFAYKVGAREVFFNLMEPLALDSGYQDEYILDDKDVCRETVAYLREAYRRAKELNISMADKILGWIFPKFPELITNEDELAILHPSDREKASISLEANRVSEASYWSKMGGSPNFGPIPSAQDPRMEKVLPMRILAPGYDVHQFTLEELPDFFCMYPYCIMNILDENTYLCCNVHHPFFHMVYDDPEGLFDLWNHQLMQFSRYNMVHGQAIDKVCHPRCPHYRNKGWLYNIFRNQGILEDCMEDKFTL